MTAARGLQGIALAAVGAGVVLTWSGIRGWSVAGTLKDFITGVDPTTQANVNPITGTPDTAAGGGSSSGSAIANDALKYEGHIYSYGGAPGTSGRNPWDCSSFVNWVVGHDVGLAIPGNKPGAYNGSSHGPPTGSWMVWAGCKTIKRADIQAGDIMVWQTHMGIAISPTEMISATGPDGTPSTKRGNIVNGGPRGEVLVPRRLNAVIARPGGGAAPASGTYTHAGLVKLWQQAGGSAATANNAACHAVQESGGNPRITSRNPDGGTNVGLWQLDTPGGAGRGYTVAQLQNPGINAMVAVRASNNGRNWSTWATPGC